MVWSLILWLFAACCLPSELYSFEVKVLLKKFQKRDLAATPLVISSKHGFVLSSHASLSIGKQYKKNNVIITSKNDKVFIGDTPLHDICYLMPLLSDNHKQIVADIVHNYFQGHQKNLFQQGEALAAFFDYFITKKSALSTTSYKTLQQYVEQIVSLFLQDITKEIENLESVVTLDTLKQQAYIFMKKKVQSEFLQQLASKKLTKKDRKLLQQDTKYRYDFFINHVHAVIQKLLQEFLLVLPRTVFALLHDQEAECLSYDTNQYRGTFAVLLEGDAVYLINCLDIDDYLLSVVRHEGWPGWPLEVNKVFAVACRTYLVWQVLQSQKVKRPYHIANDIRHQTYKGHHKYARLKKAIDETRDICIACDGRPILAMFDACCGGIVPANTEQSADFKKHEYLLRQQPCTWCKNCKVATWTIEVSYDDMINIFQREVPSLDSIDTMFVTERDKAGLVKEVTIETNGKKILVSGKKMYSLFAGIKSFCFDIVNLPRKKNKQRRRQVCSHDQYEGEKRFMITGRGYGHHVGLCQWGAMKLVKDHHWSYQKILQFYYPGTTLIKLQYRR